MSTKKSIISNYNLRGSTEKAARLGAEDDLPDAPFSSPKSRLNHAGVQAAIGRLSLHELPNPPLPPPLSSAALPQPSQGTSAAQTRSGFLQSDLNAVAGRVSSQDRKLTQLSERLATHQESQTRFNDKMEMKIDAQGSKLEAQIIAQGSRLENSMEAQKHLMQEFMQTMVSQIEALKPSSSREPFQENTPRKSPVSRIYVESADEEDEEDIHSSYHTPKRHDGTFYAVWRGRYGHQIYFDWPSCKGAVHGVSGVRYKSFATLELAEQFINEMEEASDAEKRKNAKSSARLPKQPLNVSIKPKAPAVVKGTYTYSSSLPKRDADDDNNEDDDDNSVNSSLAASIYDTSPSLRSSKESSISESSLYATAIARAAQIHEIRASRFYFYYQPLNGPLIKLPTMDTAVSLAESHAGFTMVTPTERLYYVVPPSASSKHRISAQGKPIEVRVSDPDVNEIVGGYVRPSDDLKDPAHLFPSSWMDIDKYFRFMQRAFQDHFSNSMMRERDEVIKNSHAVKREEVTQQIDAFYNYVRSLIDHFVISSEFRNRQVVAWAHILLFVHNTMSKFLANGMTPQHLDPNKFADEWLVLYKSKVCDIANHCVANLRACLRFLHCSCPYCGSLGATLEVCFEPECSKRDAARRGRNEAAAAPLKAWNEAYNRAKGAAGFSHDAFVKANPKPSTTGKIEAPKSAEDFVNTQSVLTLRPRVSTQRSDRFYS